MKLIKVNEEMHKRLMFYKLEFGFSSVNEVLEHILNKVGLASASDIERLEFFRRKQ